MKNFCLLIFVFCCSAINICMAQIAGCTDPQAINYNASATVNDGSCLYNPASVTPISGFNLPANCPETSGLIYWNNQIWTHNDNDDIHLYAIDTSDGSLLQAVVLSGSTNTDWEEISQDNNFIYIGDFGNNSNGNRTDLKILKIGKNSISAGSPQIETIYFSYSDQTDLTPAGANNTDFDCEAFIVSADSIFLFTKQWISKKTSVYSLPKIPGTYTATLKHTFDVQGLITGSTYLETDHLIALCGYSGELQPFVYLLYDFKGYDFFSANKRKILVSLPFHQVEGITTTNGLKYYISNEYFSQPPFFTVPQKLHILDLSNFSGDYLNNLYNTVTTQSFNKEILFPNPATDFINVKTEKYFLPVTYRVMNQSGYTLLTGKLTAGNQRINLTGLSSGVYILEIEKDKLQSFKVIKK